MRFYHYPALIFLLLPAGLPAATLVSYGLNGGVGAVQVPFAGVVSAINYDPRTAAIGTDGDGNTISGFSTQNDNVYMRSTGTTSSSLASGGSNAYHTFGISVIGLGANEVLNLTDVDFNYYGTGSWSTNAAIYFSFYSDEVGLADADRLGNLTLAGSSNITALTNANIDLTPTNLAAGTAFTGLANGTDIHFRIYFGDNLSGGAISDTQDIQRIKRFLTISGDIQTILIPEPASVFLVLAALSGLILIRPSVDAVTLPRHHRAGGRRSYNASISAGNGRHVAPAG